jgi:hypothetical protein
MLPGKCLIASSELKTFSVVPTVSADDKNCVTSVCGNCELLVMMSVTVGDNVVYEGIRLDATNA